MRALTSVFVTWPIPELGLTILRSVADEVYANSENRPLSKEELIAAASSSDAVLCTLRDQIDADVLSAAGRCRIFANMAVGFNNVDVTEASRRGILVSNTPGILTDSTADLTWALILGVARRLVEGDREMRNGRFGGWRPTYMLGGDVSGATLGIIGSGRIAAAVARRAVGFGMRLLYFGRRPKPEFETLAATLVSMDELLRRSDFVSVHVSLNDGTHHLIDSRALGLMKRTAYLINTARGAVVDEAALVTALQTGTIAGAGLDVYEDEPRMAEGLAGCANVVLLPHLGSSTSNTRAAMAKMAAENVADALQGRRPMNLVNPEIWPASAS